MGLKVFDLQCDNGHIFEGWFKSHENYEEQRGSGLLRCPVCDSAELNKKLSAPRLNISHLKNESSSSAPVTSQESSSSGSAAVAAPGSADLAKLQAEMLHKFRDILRKSDDVGVRFADEARRMHNGEVEERSIRGSATPDEYAELAEEGIAVMPIPEFLDDDRLQ